MTARWLGKLTFWRGIAAILFAAGLYATWTRFAHGLGAATHLSDRFPWGLWIGFDVLVGVGLAAGGFVVAATVHIFRIEKYAPIARPAVLTAFLGYLLVIIALLFDLGRPYRIWHPLVMWNPHSVMFEVAWCVMLYTAVLALEFSPLVFERFGWQRPLRVMRAVYGPLVIVGVLLSTMHQSSLGTLYVIVPDKLHPLWYSPFLPVFFFISAIAGGLAITIFESFMSYRAFGKRLEAEILEGIGRVIVVVLAVYATWRFEDLAARGSLGHAFQITPESVLFWGEMSLGVLLPMALFAIPRVRRSPNGLFFAAMLTVMGFVINRLNVSITGMLAWSGSDYFPSWMEFAVTMAIVAAGFVLFGLAVRYLPVFPAAEMAEIREVAARARVVRRGPVFAGRALAALWLLLLAGTAAVAFSMKRSNSAEEAAAPEVATAAAPAFPRPPLRLPADYTFPGADSPGPVVFSHTSHVDPAQPSCGACHATLFRLDEPGRAVSGKVNGDRMHQELCGACHDGKAAFSIEEGCDVCHQQ